MSLLAGPIYGLRRFFNQKCGNKYLAWAFVEAANFARRYDENCRRWYDRKAAKAGKIIATKALACKLAKAAWHVMAQHVADGANKSQNRRLGMDWFPGTQPAFREEGIRGLSESFEEDRGKVDPFLTASVVSIPFQR